MMVDDMGYAGPSIAPYGNPHYQTPGMDRLAREGMLFTDFHSSGTVCSPTRAALLTGRYQQRVGVEAVIHPRSDHPEHRKGLHKSEITFAELFKEAGYVTGVVGKWHLGYAGENPEYHPQNHGFDYFKGYHSGNIDYINHWGDHMKHDWWHGRKETPEKGYTTHLINTYALEFIVQNKDKPFCLYVAHESPHSPVQGPNDPVQRGPGAQKRITPHAEAMKQMILEMDKGVEQVRAKLVELGLEKNTLFLFFSDNGDAPKTATGHPSHRGHKGSVYEGGTRVPAIAWWPGKIKPGTSTDALSITLDVMPTILSVAGIEKPKHRALDGIDLSPVLFEQKVLPVRALYWGSLSNNGARSEALRDGPWKLVVQHPKAKPGTFANERIELFRLDKDLGEENNLAAKEPQRAAAMLKQLKAWYADTQETATYQPGGWVPRPQRDVSFFNRKDLAGWSAAEMRYWSVVDGAIVGHSEVKVPGNKFLWADGEVQDFYLALDVKLTPDHCNAGIQFRSKKANASGQALGYQADVGAGVWGKLYHEHGRGKLDWNNNATGAVKPGDWNRYEILAVGHRIWTAINGTLCVALEDPDGELSGKIALQVHGGPPQHVAYRNPTLTHNPPVALAGLDAKELAARLNNGSGPKTGTRSTPSPRIRARGEASTATTAAPDWKKLIAERDPGSQGEAWAKPGFDHRKWKTMNIPGHFEQAGLPGYDGVVWFRKTIDLSPAQAGMKARLHLGQIDDMDVTWVNGTRVGGYEEPGHHYTVRNYAIPAGLLRPGTNTIAVRVMDHGSPGGMAGKAEHVALQLGSKRVSLASPWHFAPGATLAALRDTAKPQALSPASETTTGDFSKGFSLDENEVVAFIGGSIMVKQMASGALETLLTQAAGDLPVYFRDLAWQADTVYLRQRPRNFGSQAEMLQRIQASVVVAAFGQMEVLEGIERLPAFIQAYEEVLDQVQTRTRKIVLITPYPFATVIDQPHIPRLTPLNETVRAYAEAIIQLGKRRGLLTVDLSRFDTGGITTDGIQLTPGGHAKWAAVVTRQLLGEPAAVAPAHAAVLQRHIQEKNLLWKRHWRPSNWAFLYGNRQQVPSSKDHRPGKPRWFPLEVNAIIPQIEAAESRIFALRKAGD
jgi:arylsulfatase A-like enzyme